MHEGAQARTAIGASSSDDTQASTDSISPLRIALAPRSARFNRFTGLFGDALAGRGHAVGPFRPWLAEMAKEDVIIYHWPHRLLPEAMMPRIKTVARLLMARHRFGTRLVWVAHNVAQHEGGKGPSLVEKFLVRHLDGIIYLSEKSRELVHEAYRIPKGVVEVVTVHGAYEDAPPAPFTAPEPEDPARLLTFGLVRPYKNLDELVAACEGLNPHRVQVTVYGRRHDREYADMLEYSASTVASLTMALSEDILPEAVLERAIDGAHGIVLPYRNILNSGAAIHALSRGRPVLVPAKGSMPELQKLIGPQWVHLYDGGLTSARLESFATAVREIPPGAVPDLRALGWDRVAADLERFLLALVPAGHRARSSEPSAGFL